MTDTITPRDLRSQINGHVPTVDSPAAPTRARARMTDTKRDVKPGGGKPPWRALSLSGWWVWTSRPASYEQTWAASKVDRTRIPASSAVLLWAWRVSNWTDRLLMFALIAVCPPFLTGALRWCATRPLRRYGLYLTLIALTGAYFIERMY